MDLNIKYHCITKKMDARSISLEVLPSYGKFIIVLKLVLTRNDEMRQVCFIGMGYVGLCTAVCFANRGFNTLISTKNSRKAEMVNNGLSPFYEPQLDELLKEAIESGKLKATVGRRRAILESDVTFITVGTPANSDGSINLRFVKKASEEIGEALRGGQKEHLVVVKSTVTPETTEKIVKANLEECSERTIGAKVLLCFSPEFLREGNAIFDTLHPNYLVIGEHDEKSGDRLEELYRGFYWNTCPPIIRTNPSTAELIKYANNAFLATKISFINAFANICERTAGVDIKIISDAIGKDHRIDPHFLDAGLGWGGSCFPKDMRTLIAYCERLSFKPSLLNAVYRTNQDQIEYTIQKAKRELGTLKGKRIAILGLSFKPKTDDIRESRSIRIIEKLLELGVEIVAYDPIAIPNTKECFEGKISFAESSKECLKDADCALLATEWEEFKKLKPDDFTRNMRTPLLIDGRRIYNPKEFSRRLRYIAIGLGESPPLPSTTQRNP